MADLKNTSISDTGFVQIPIGTTGQRPGSPTNGGLRFNTTTGRAEYYNATALSWLSTQTLGTIATGGTRVFDITQNGVDYRVHVFTQGTGNFVVTRGGEVEYLIVAGGGGGGSKSKGTSGGTAGGAGGGAGGFLTGTFNVTPQTYTIVTGAGGQGGGFPSGSSTTSFGSNGGNSSAFGLTAIGGGGGASNGGGSGATGGSGGGASSVSGGGGGFTAGQGNPGGGAVIPEDSAYPRGGGGGAGAAGGNAVNGVRAGRGGPGLLSSIAGVGAFYAAGGGGSWRNGSDITGAALGGVGGGGNGGIQNSTQVGVFPGADQSMPPAGINTGSGGGGQAGSDVNLLGHGGFGANGIVIIRYKLLGDRVSTANRFVTDGLVLDIDAGKPASYPGTGTTTTDSRSFPITGTLQNGTGIENACTNAAAFVFDGTDDRITVGRIPGNFSEFTVLVWFNATEIANFRNVLDCNYNAFSASGNIGPRLEMNSAGVLNWVIGGDPTNNSIADGVPILTGTTANVWRYVGITRNAATQLSGFLNGTITTNQQANPSGFVSVFDNLWIGRGFHLSNDAERSFRGVVGSVQIYNRALSQAEIQQNYEATRWRYGV